MATKKADTPGHKVAHEPERLEDIEIIQTPEEIAEDTPPPSASSSICFRAPVRIQPGSRRTRR